MKIASSSNLKILSCFVGATRVFENTMFTVAVPSTEFKYTNAEYALAEALVKQNILYSSPPTNILG